MIWIVVVLILFIQLVFFINLRVCMKMIDSILEQQLSISEILIDLDNKKLDKFKIVKTEEE